MQFIFTATTEKGLRRRGSIEARTRADALRELKRKKLVVVSLSQEGAGAALRIPYVSGLEKVIMTKHLAIMLKAGIALPDALETLEDQSSGYLKVIVARVRVQVEGGNRLGDAMAAHPHVFSEYYVNMVRAGEESGTLAENLEQLATRFGKDYELRRKAQSAMFYPALVLTLTVGLGLLISLFVLPKLSTLFRSFDFELPWSTRVLIAASNFLAKDGFLTLAVAIVGMFLGIALLKTSALRPIVHRFYLRIPLFGGVARGVNLARFSMVLGSLLRSGVAIDRALPISGKVLSNEAYRQAIRDAGRRVGTGESLSAILAEHPDLFPPFVDRMIAVGEQTGKMDDMLFYLSEFYEAELDATLKNMATFIEPVLLIVIGLLVAFTALAIITPVYGFIDAIG